jgi:F-type H+-transporting ATPase subunit delta
VRTRPELYAEAFYGVIVAEGEANEIQDELFRFAKTIDGNDQLRNTLSDPHLPAAVREQIVQDLLEGKALDTTVSLINLVVGTGRIRELSAIVDHLLERTAMLGSKTIAEVRSAVPLTDDQKARLAASIKASQGLDVDIVVIVDPSVLGGVVTQIGDKVIDGSVRHRLAQLKESF